MACVRVARGWTRLMTHRRNARQDPAGRVSDIGVQTGEAPKAVNGNRQGRIRGPQRIGLNLLHQHNPGEVC